MIGRKARGRASWLWVALTFGGTACGGNVTSGSGEESPPGPAETPDEPLPARAFEVEAGPRDPDDPAEAERFTLPPGDEDWICFTQHLDNPERVQARRVFAELGDGVARVHVNAVHDDRSTGLDPCDGHLPYVPLLAEDASGFDPEVPENAGLAFELEPHARILVWIHALNPTDHDVIARATIRLEESREPATHILRPLLWSVPEPDTEDGEYIESGKECLVESERRIASLAMHTHDGRALTSRVTLEAPSAGLVYSLLRPWPVPAPLFFDSRRNNGISLGFGGPPTGRSGIVAVLPGDSLGFRCTFEPDEGGPWGPLEPRDYGCTVFGSYTAEPGSDAVWRCE